MLRPLHRDFINKMRVSRIEIWTADLFAEQFDRTMGYAGNLLFQLAQRGVLERVSRGTYRVLPFG